MRRSCNGCRALRKGCSESCVLRPCLHWIRTAESQANATAFLAKFYGRTGLTNLITNGPEHLRPAIFRSLLYDACGRILNPISGSLGLVLSGNWAVCEAGLQSILRGDSASYTVPMEAMAGELNTVKPRGRFKGNSRAQPKQKKREPAPINKHIDSSTKSDGCCGIKNTLHSAADNGEQNTEHDPDEFVTANHAQREYCHDLICNLNASQPEGEALCNTVELELTLGSQGSTSYPHKLLLDDRRCSEAHCMENYLP